MFIESYEMVVLYHQTTMTFILVPFAFASLSFLRYSFASTTIISYVYYDSNFFICFLLYIEDHIEVSTVEVSTVLGSMNSSFFFK